MLILSRRVDESIIIGDNIKITIVMIGSYKCKIGVTAPEDVVVDREEVHLRRIEGDRRGR